MANKKELPEYPGQLGLNDLLKYPELITRLDQGYKKLEIIKPEMWQEIYGVVGAVTPLLQESDRLDKRSSNDVFTVQLGADNGVLFAFRNTKDTTQTTSVYVSSHGKETSDWGPGLAIAPDRVLCHQLMIVSRKKVAPHIYSASAFKLRVSPDFRFIEGDPSYKQELEAIGMMSDNKTFMFDTFTRSQVAFIEVEDPHGGVKVLSPLIAMPRDVWRLTADSNRGEIFWRLFAGKLEPADEARLKDLEVEFGGVTTIDFEGMMEMGKEIAGDLMAQAQATLRGVPVTLGYLKDLRKNLENSHPVSISNEVMLAKTFDGMGIGRKKYLEKRTARMIR